MDNTSRPEFRGAGRSLEVLRAEAHDELQTLIELRCRAGEDPWEVIPELPSVDEQVVISLCSLASAGRGTGPRTSLGHSLQGPADDRADSFGHASAGSARGLGLDDELEFLRGIALWHPELSRAVWSLMGRLHDVGGRP